MYINTTIKCLHDLHIIPTVVLIKQDCMLAIKVLASWLMNLDFFFTFRKRMGRSSHEKRNISSGWPKPINLQKNKYLICRLRVGPYSGKTAGLKMLPLACHLRQHFQDLGYSFSLYGPPSRQITYIFIRGSINHCKVPSTLRWRHVKTEDRLFG